jgi:hypothetical protein
MFPTIDLLEPFLQPSCFLPFFMAISLQVQFQILSVKLEHMMIFLRILQSMLIAKKSYASAVQMMLARHVNKSSPNQDRAMHM